MQVVEIHYGEHELYDYKGAYRKDEDIDIDSFKTASSFHSTDVDEQLHVNKVECKHCYGRAIEFTHVNSGRRQADDANDQGPHSSSSSSHSKEVAVDTRSVVSEQTQLESRSRQLSVQDQARSQMRMKHTRLGPQQQTQAMPTVEPRSSDDKTQESPNGMIHPSVKACPKWIERSITETTVCNERSFLSPWLPSAMLVAIDASPEQACFQFLRSIRSATPEPGVAYFRDSPQRQCVLIDSGSSVRLPSAQAASVSSTPLPHRFSHLPLTIPFPFPYLPLLITPDSTACSSPNRMIGSWREECATTHSRHSIVSTSEPFPLDGHEDDQSGISSTANRDCKAQHTADCVQQDPEQADILQNLSRLICSTGAATFDFLSSLPSQFSTGFPQALLPQLFDRAANDRDAQSDASTTNNHALNANKMTNNQPVEHSSSVTQSHRRSDSKSGAIVCAHKAVLHAGADDLLAHDLTLGTGYRHRSSTDIDSTDESDSSVLRSASDSPPKQLHTSKLKFKVKSKSKCSGRRPLQTIPGPEGLDPEIRRELEAQGLSALDLYDKVFDRRRRQWWDPRRYGLKKFIVCDAMRRPRPCTMVLLSILTVTIACTYR